MTPETRILSHCPCAMGEHMASVKLSMLLNYFFFCVSADGINYKYWSGRKKNIVLNPRLKVRVGHVTTVAAPFLFRVNILILLKWILSVLLLTHFRYFNLSLFDRHIFFRIFYFYFTTYFLVLPVCNLKLINYMFTLQLIYLTYKTYEESIIHDDLL